MAANSQKKDERIEFRVSEDFKSLVARAAEMSGTSLSAFIIESSREHALRCIADFDRIVLNNQARDVVMEALANPPAPGAALRRAADKHAIK